VIGAGVLGSIVAAVFFYLQESGEYEANKSKSVTFFNNKLLLDIKEVESRNPSLWNLSGLNKFYFDGSRINPLYDVYQHNFDNISNYTAYFPEDDLIQTYTKFYKKVRQGYVLGEKLENLINQLVRAEHHKANVISPNDPPMRAYLKAKLFANLPDAEINKHLEWNTTHQRAIELLKIAEQDTQIKELIKNLQDMRAKLLKLESQILNKSRNLKQH